MNQTHDTAYQRLTEALDLLWNRLVDPLDARLGDDGTLWPVLGTSGGRGEMPATELGEIRARCRQLAMTNEFAINGHENRISYIVGSGHRYRVLARPGAEVDESLLAEAQAVLDEFVETNRWHHRQQEIVRRKDRDGECFLRLFVDHDGHARLRFVEPEQVATPADAAGRADHASGIVTEPGDVETVRAYYVDGDLVPADQIQHRKLGVDANVRRGVPLFYPVIKNLRRAERLLRNMSVLTEIQSAIALIRKHAASPMTGIEQFVADGADASVTDSSTGRTTHARAYGPGTILDASVGIDYEFPAAGINAAGYVAVLGAELRAIAARLVMPEFMLTSDAAGANYASTMVAEGPAVKMFQRLQHDMCEDDRELLGRVLRAASSAGRLPSDIAERVHIDVTLPTLAVRDRLRDAQADQILLRNGAMSTETMATRHGLDPQVELTRVAAARSQAAVFPLDSRDK